MDSLHLMTRILEYAAANLDKIPEKTARSLERRLLRDAAYQRNKRLRLKVQLANLPARTLTPAELVVKAAKRAHKTELERKRNASKRLARELAVEMQQIELQLAATAIGVMDASMPSQHQRQHQHEPESVEDAIMMAEAEATVEELHMDLDSETVPEDTLERDFVSKIDLTKSQRVQLVYSRIEQATGQVGGNGDGGPIYGELTLGSMQKIIHVLVSCCALVAASRFLDVGSGRGKPNFHVAQDPGVRLSIGVEVVAIRFAVSSIAAYKYVFLSIAALISLLLFLYDIIRIVIYGQHELHLEVQTSYHDPGWPVLCLQ